METIGINNKDNDKYGADAGTELEKHPCFSLEASHSYGRVHLPVAARCNISCNYCHRDYDCPNESRPGVTSRLLKPEEAILRIYEAKKFFNNISVAAVAGPGDSLADPENTFKTFELIKKEFPEMVLCMSTNGLNLAENVKYLDEIGVKFVTVTLNSIDTGIASKIYRYVNYKGVTYRGEEAAGILLEKQLEGIRLCAGNGFLIKINTVLIPGINDLHIKELSEAVKKLGVYLFNVMPMIPAERSFFHKMGIKGADRHDVVNAANGLEGINIMKHCRQCRSDAVGLLGNDLSAKFNEEAECGQEECCSK